MKNSNILLKNGAAGGVAQISAVVVRFAQVFLLLGTLGVEEYGRWLILYTVPSAILLGNIGIGYASATKMVAEAAINDYETASRAYTAGLAFTLVVAILLVAISFVVVETMPWAAFMGMERSRLAEIQTSATCLSLAAIATLPVDLYAGKFNSKGKTALSIYLVALRPWFEVLAILAASFLSSGIKGVAVGVLIASAMHLAVYLTIANRCAPDIRITARVKLKEDAKFLFRKGGAFQAIAAGHIIQQQGSLLVVQSILGASAVAAFGTMRTLVASVLQAIGVVNTATLPEFVKLLASGQEEEAKRLYRISVCFAISIGLLGAVALFFFGSYIYSVWTHNALDVPRSVLYGFLASIPLCAIYTPGLAVLVALNDHEGFALRHFLAAILVVAATALFSVVYGLEGAAVAQALIYLVPAPYVVSKSLSVVKDTAGGVGLHFWMASRCSWALVSSKLRSKRGR